MGNLNKFKISRYSVCQLTLFNNYGVNKILDTIGNVRTTPKLRSRGWRENVYFTGGFQQLGTLTAGKYDFVHLLDFAVHRADR